MFGSGEFSETGRGENGVLAFVNGKLCPSCVNGKLHFILKIKERKLYKGKEPVAVLWWKVYCTYKIYVSHSCEYCDEYDH